MATPLGVLIIEDSEDDVLLFLRELRRGGYEPVCERVETPQAMRKALEDRQWDVVISDDVLPGLNSMDALALLKENGLDLPFIIVSGDVSEEIVAAMKAGAHDYLIKGKLAGLALVVERELREAAKRHERRCAEEERERHRQHLEDLVRRYTADLEAANSRVQKMLAEVKILEGLLPVCAACKKIRDDAGTWSPLEAYISKCSKTSFNHGICPDCARRLYPELYAGTTPSPDPPPPPGKPHRPA